jgi:hypothetical protein
MFFIIVAFSLSSSPVISFSLSADMHSKASRDSNSAPVSNEKAEEDAQKLFRAGEGTLGTDEKVFVQVFGTLLIGNFLWQD